VRKYLRGTAALCAFFVVGIAVSACGGGVPGNSVASVAGNPITLQAFQHWMYVAAKSQAAQSGTTQVIVPNDPPQFTGCIAQVRQQIPSLAKTAAKQLRSDCKELFTQYSSQVMDFLIKAYWYQGEASRLGIKVTNKQVQQAFETAKKQQFPTAAQYNSFLSETGQTNADILYRFRINQIYTKLLARHTKTVTTAEIQKYYASHMSQFGTPQTRNLRIVLAKSLSEANAAKSALQSGQSWKTVAKKYSTDPTSKNNGGLLVGVEPGEEDAALSKAAFAAPLNKLLGPVKGTFGYYVFEVIKIKPSTQKSLAQATSLIRQTLTGQAQTNAETAVNNTASKHWKSKTSCRSAYAMADCPGYKAPKTSTTPTGATGSG
jgi:foldase protein PrsA